MPTATTSRRATAAKVLAHIDSLFELLTAQGQGNYIGESVSQLEHCLQAAHFATQDGAERTTVVAALLHDVGQFIPLSIHNSGSGTEMLDESGQSVGRKSHDQLGATFLQAHGWPPSVYELVGAHVQAKRYLSTDPTYLASLSKTSQASLRAQGGPFTKEQMRHFEQDPLWKDKLRLRIYDDQSKVPGLQVNPLESYRHDLLLVLTAALEPTTM